MLKLKYKKNGTLLNGKTLDDLTELTNDVFNGNLNNTITVSGRDFILLRIKWGYYLNKVKSKK